MGQISLHTGVDTYDFDFVAMRSFLDILTNIAFRHVGQHQERCVTHVICTQEFCTWHIRTRERELECHTNEVHEDGPTSASPASLLLPGDAMPCIRDLL